MHKTIRYLLLSLAIDVSNPASGAPLIYEPIHNLITGHDVGIAQVVRGPFMPTLVYVTRPTPDIKVINDTGYDITDFHWQIPSQANILAGIYPVGTNHPVQPTQANTANQGLVMFGDAGGDGQVGDSGIFKDKNPKGVGPTTDLAFFNGIVRGVKAKDEFTDFKSLMKDAATGAAVPWVDHWALVSYSVLPSALTGQVGAGTSSPSLLFDAATGVLSMTDFSLSSAYVTDSLFDLDVNRVDPAFTNDPVLGATLSISPFHLAYSFVENGVEKFFFENPAGMLRLASGSNTLLTASLHAGMIFDPTLAIPFFIPLADINISPTINSAFLNDLLSRQLDPNQLSFDFFISPRMDFLAATNNFTSSATSVADGAIAQNGLVSEPNSVMVFSIGILALALARRSRHCER